MDAEGAVWIADALAGRAIRVLPGGEVVDEVRHMMPVFACALGGDDGRDLQQWRHHSRHGEASGGGRADPGLRAVPRSAVRAAGRGVRRPGFYVEKPADLRPALDKAISSGGPSIVHVVVDPRADRKPQEHFWKG